MVKLQLMNIELHRQLLVDGNQYENQYKTPIIPFRELFISVPLISKTFSQKQNLNDALDSILEKINSDSYGVFKLKMISLNNSLTVSFQDANLVPPPPENKEDYLIFDVLLAILVSNLDYNFELPKGGLSSIAIGNKGDYEFMDDPFKDNLNFIRILSQTDSSQNNDVFYKSLPLNPEKTDIEKNEEEKITQYDFTPSSTKKIVSKITTGLEDTTSGYKDAVNAVMKRKSEIKFQPDPIVGGRLGFVTLDLNGESQTSVWES